MRASDLVAPFSGTRMPVGLVDDFEARCRALSAVLRPGDAFTGPTAARLWQIPLPRRLDPHSLVHVGHSSADRQVRRRGVQGASQPPGAVLHRVGGVPVVDPFSCWMDLSRFLDVPDLVAAGDFLVTGDRGRGALLELDELIARVRSAPTGCRGIRAQRSAAARIRRGAWSRPESLLRWLLESSGIPEAECNPDLLFDGRRIVPDLWWPEFRVAAEYEGRHHADPAQWSHDLARSEVLADHGVRVIHVTAEDLFRVPGMLVRRVAGRLRAAGWVNVARVEMPKNVVLRS